VTAAVANGELYIRQFGGSILTEPSSTFDTMYGKTGRPSIPPERLLESQISMARYSVRSDRQFCEQLDYNLLFRWLLERAPTSRRSAPAGPVTWASGTSASSTNRIALRSSEVVIPSLAAIDLVWATQAFWGYRTLVKWMLRAQAGALHCRRPRSHHVT